MAAGDVEVQILDATDASAMETAIAGMRTTANDKWLAASTANGIQIIIVNIEEA